MKVPKIDWPLFWFTMWLMQMIYILFKQGGDIMYDILKTLAKPQMSILMMMKLYC